MAEYPNQCVGCGGPISWSRWFCNWCAEAEGLTVALGLCPSKPCPCACHKAIQPGLIPCPTCAHSSRYESPDA